MDQTVSENKDSSSLDLEQVRSLNQKASPFFDELSHYFTRFLLKTVEIPDKIGYISNLFGVVHGFYHPHYFPKGVVYWNATSEFFYFHDKPLSLFTTEECTEFLQSAKLEKRATSSYLYFTRAYFLYPHSTFKPNIIAPLYEFKLLSKLFPSEANLYRFLFRHPCVRCGLVFISFEKFFIYQEYEVVDSVSPFVKIIRNQYKVLSLVLFGHMLSQCDLQRCEFSKNYPHLNLQSKYTFLPHFVRTQLGSFFGSTSIVE